MHLSFSVPKKIFIVFSKCCIFHAKEIAKKSQRKLPKYVIINIFSYFQQYYIRLPIHLLVILIKHHLSNSISYIENDFRNFVHLLQININQIVVSHQKVVELERQQQMRATFNYLVLFIQLRAVTFYSLRYFNGIMCYQFFFN